MAGARGRGFFVGLLLAAAVWEPANAFSLFGVHLWGAREDENQIEVIDPLPYTVTFDVSGVSGGAANRIKDASSLWTDRESPASGVGGLLSKARGDYRRLLGALYAAGFYGPYISIQAAGKEVADLTLAVDLPPNVPMTIRVETGPRFAFGRTEIVNAPPWNDDMDDEVATPASIGFETGERALSGVINQASALTVERWRQLSHAKAREADREAIADHANDRLDVTLTMDPGRAAHYGAITANGSRRVDPAFITYMSALRPGQPFDPDDITDAQTRLTSLGVFRSLRFTEGDEIAPDGSLPITIDVEDRRPRTVGVGATLSTIDGIGVTAFWLQRNLFGRAESLRFDVGVDGLGGSLNPDDYDYNLGVTFTKPGVFDPDTSFAASLLGERADYDTYRKRSVTASVGLNRSFGRDFTGSIAAVAARARYDDDAFGVRHFTLVGLSGTGTLDRRDDPLEPTRGYYFSAMAAPAYDFEYGNPMAQTTVEGRGYLGFGEERHVVLAGRLKVGNFFGPDAAESPPDLLFFAGGGGSVRGYAYKSIGVPYYTDVDGVLTENTIGGAGLIEASGELRYRINERYGAVGFLDAGYVTETETFGGESTFKTGAGIGARYYTPIGTLRFDLATPLQPESGDSRIAFYIGIGQAF